MALAAEYAAPEGNRTPGEDQIKAIAAALDISPESLRQVPVESSRQALELLFRLEDAFGLVPHREGGRIVLEPDTGSQGAQKLCQALKVWAEKVDSLESGEIDRSEYDEWKASFGAS